MPWTTLAFTIGALGMIGIPPVAGFVSKWFLGLGALEAGAGAWVLPVLVASSLPLDQYMIRNPEFFLGASPEQARIDPDQLLILLDHIRCAAFELPFRDGEAFGKEKLNDMLAYLEEHGVVHREGNQWHWMTDSYPANSVSLRSVAEGNFVVIDTKARKISTTRSSGENRSSSFTSFARTDGVIFLQGMESGRAFSFVIDEATGRMTVAVSRDVMAVTVFGACTSTDL